MPKQPTLKEAIAQANTGTRFPVMQIVRNDPGTAAVLSKLIPGIDPAQYDQKGRRSPVAPDVAAFNALSDKTAQGITDAETVMQMLPDMELASQILISSIISPKDMMTTEVGYTAAEGLLPPEVSSAMLTCLRTFFDQDYKIKPLLPKMLKDMLFRTGSYPTAVIPENSIDEIINGNRTLSMEELSDNINSDGTVRPVGLLGPAVKKTPTATRNKPGLAMESFGKFYPDTSVDGRMTFEGLLDRPVDDSFVHVTDNFSLLKIPRINQKIREQKIANSIGSRAMESISQMTDREVSGRLYKNPQFNFKPINELKTQDQLNRTTIGNPLVIHLPSESVIPVHVPGCPEEQIGFFVLIDADGNPISKASNTDYYQELSQRMNSNGNFASAMLTKVKSQMDGFSLNNSRHLDYSVRSYAAMVEQDLLARLRNGVYGNGVEISKQDEVYRIMFSRALARQHTQLLFIPAELMTYFAFRYNNDGIGKSLLDDMKILNSLRAMMLFSNVMAALKNSIGRTEVKLKLDDQDPDPSKTIEQSIHEIVRSRQQAFPLGLSSPVDLTNYLQRAAYEFTFEGHPGLPDVTVDFGEKSSTYTKPDTELEDSLRKRSLMATGVSPEAVDTSFQAEFATSIITSNVLMSKRVMQTQEDFMAMVTDHVRKYIRNSENLLRDLREILKNNFNQLKVEELKNDKGETIEVSAKEKARAKEALINQFLSQFIATVEVNLPRPNSISLETQMTAMDTYSKALDAALDAWISESFFVSDTGGDVAGQVSTAKAAVKAHFLRQWMSENGVMTEIGHLTAKGENGKPKLDILNLQVTHISGLTESLTEYLVKLQPSIKKSNEKIEAIGGVSDESGGSGSSDGGSADGSGDLGGGGFGDLNLDQDFSGDGSGGSATAGGPPVDEDPEPNTGGEPAKADTTEKTTDEAGGDGKTKPDDKPAEA